MDVERVRRMVQRRAAQRQVGVVLSCRQVLALIERGDRDEIADERSGTMTEREVDPMEVLAQVHVRRGLRELLSGAAMLKATEVARALVASEAVDQLDAQLAVFDLSSRINGSGEPDPMEVDVRVEEPRPAALEAGNEEREEAAGDVAPLTATKPHRCPVCGVPISASAVGCRKHWRQVKREMGE